jgi:hypothetical protein
VSCDHIGDAWRLLSPNTALSALVVRHSLAAESNLAAGVGADDGHTTWNMGMEVPLRGRRWPPIGMPFATAIGRPTVVHVGTILVAVKPTWA